MARTQFIDFNNSEVIAFSNKLDKIGGDVIAKVAISTVNDLAFDAKGARGKTGSIEKYSRKSATYDRANKGFYKAITDVDKAPKNQTNINRIESQAGISKRNTKLNITAEGMGKFDSGGSTQKNFNPVDDNRTGKQRGRLMGSGQSPQRIGGRVSKRQVSNMKPSDFVRVKKGHKGRTYIAAATKAFNSRKYLLIEESYNRGLLIEVTSFYSSVKSRKAKIISRVMGYYDEGRVIKQKPTRFMFNSTKDTMKSMPKYFEKNAKFRFKKAGFK